MADSFNNMYGIHDIAAAEQRVRNMSNMERRYAESYRPPPMPAPVTEDISDIPAESFDDEEKNENTKINYPDGGGLFGLRLPIQGIDTEKLLLAVIIVLLASEGADLILIAALVYIMM